MGTRCLSKTRLDKWRFDIIQDIKNDASITYILISQCNLTLGKEIFQFKFQNLSGNRRIEYKQNIQINILKNILIKKTKQKKS